MRQRSRNATVVEIDRRIRNALDYMGALVAQEQAAQKAAAACDVDAEYKALQQFERDLQALLSAARTARNYLIQAANESGCRDWLDEQLAPDIFAFHGALADQDMHDHGIRLARPTIYD